jgi:hypothetical protein
MNIWAWEIYKCSINKKNKYLNIKIYKGDIKWHNEELRMKIRQTNHECV